MLYFRKKTLCEVGLQGKNEFKPDWHTDKKKKLEDEQEEYFENKKEILAFLVFQCILALQKSVRHQYLQYLWMERPQLIDTRRSNQVGDSFLIN